MITEEKLDELRNSIANRPRSLRAKTVVIGLRQAFEMLDTLSALWRVAKAAENFNKRYLEWAGNHAKSPLNEPLAALREGKEKADEL